MVTISLCMIVKDEEAVLDNCLSSVADLVDEIIIVDTGSTDKTKEIAMKYTDKVYDFEWIYDFSAARNVAFDKATCDYQFWLDADDILLPEDQKKFAFMKNYMTMDMDIDIVTFIYHYSLDEEGRPLLTFHRERLLKREKNYRWVGKIHECIYTEGKVAMADVIVTHTKKHGVGDRNLYIFQRMINNGDTFTSRDMYCYANELYGNQLWEKAVDEYERVLKENICVEDRIDSTCKLSDSYVMLGKIAEGRKHLYDVLEYTVPRAEVIYRIANTYEIEKKYPEAIYWYETILAHPDIPNVPGFINPELWTWRPHLQLCICYYAHGDIKKSYEHHKIAYAAKPDDELNMNHEKVFSDLLLKGALL